MRPDIYTVEISLKFDLNDVFEKPFSILWKAIF